MNNRLLTDWSEVRILPAEHSEKPNAIGVSATSAPPVGGRGGVGVNTAKTAGDPPNRGGAVVESIDWSQIYPATEWGVNGAVFRMAPADELAPVLEVQAGDMLFIYQDWGNAGYRWFEREVYAALMTPAARVAAAVRLEPGELEIACRLAAVLRSAAEESRRSLTTPLELLLKEHNKSFRKSLRLSRAIRDRGERLMARAEAMVGSSTLEPPEAIGDVAGVRPAFGPRIGIYFLLRGGEVVYVGQSSTSIDSRLRCHHKDKDFDEAWWIPCQLDDLDALEARYIRRFNPILNKARPADYRFGGAL
jgi:hypothetical protein